MVIMRAPCVRMQHFQLAQFIFRLVQLRLSTSSSRAILSRAARIRCCASP